MAPQRMEELCREEEKNRETFIYLLSMNISSKHEYFQSPQASAKPF